MAARNSAAVYCTVFVLLATRYPLLGYVQLAPLPGSTCLSVPWPLPGRQLCSRVLEKCLLDARSPILWRRPAISFSGAGPAGNLLRRRWGGGDYQAYGVRPTDAMASPHLVGRLCLSGCPSSSNRVSALQSPPAP
jgi:hypothetical protein